MHPIGTPSMLYYFRKAKISAVENPLAFKARISSTFPVRNSKFFHIYPRLRSMSQKTFSGNSRDNFKSWRPVSEVDGSFQNHIKKSQ